MPQLAVEKLARETHQTLPVVDELKTLSEQIRQRAFETFERRGGGDGLEINDWLRAERELFRIPETELIERDGKFEARVSAPGFDPGDVKVIALLDALIVKVSSSHKHDQHDGNIRFCEFDQKTLFRRLDLPAPINVDKVTASLDKGILQLTALKSAATHPAASKPPAAPESEDRPDAAK